MRIFIKELRFWSYTKQFEALLMAFLCLILKKVNMHFKRIKTTEKPDYSSKKPEFVDLSIFLISFLFGNMKFSVNYFSTKIFMREKSAFLTRKSIKK